MSFKEIDERYDGPALEQDILALWREKNVFGESLKRSAGRPQFIWYEGPPTANGRPGIHHVLARTFKDLFPRYKTMQGFHCPRKAGWDTHGLPVEHEVEKQLGIFDKDRIEKEVGIAEFTRRCRESVMRYIDDWEVMTERMGFWVDLDEAYSTLENGYIESVWSLIKNIWDQGLVYQGYKVVPYDPRIGATLSSHEVSLGYKEVEDPSVTVRFRWRDEPKTSFLVWTTTPWTLPSNLALAVGADVDYVWVREGEETFVLAKALLNAVMGEGEHDIVREAKGSELEGVYYERLFDYLPVEGDVCRVRLANFVTVEDGTGIVHIAPAYGEDDLKLGQKHGLPVLHGVGLDGRFVEEVEPVAGMFFKEADPKLIEILRERGNLYRAEKYLHNYPFGWRTGDPLIYYAKNAWYIRTTDVADRMVELNQGINWVPESIRDGRFGNWLENNIDWALSRERFWGTPLPLWTDGEGDFVAIGSVAQLEKLTGRSLSDVDLHRPAVDEIVFTHPDNGREYRRVPEVIDCWFDSGAMPFAQWHYPFDNHETFEKSFPADYICEAIDQTRGWFYTLHAIATMVKNDVAYRNCICLSHVVDDEGRKMSKSKGNIVDPWDVFDAVGADALRWYFAARLLPEKQKRVSVDIVREVASTFLNTLWNTYGFFVLYARLDKFDAGNDVPVEQRPEIDRWVLALAQHTVRTVTEALDAYDARAAGMAIESFVDQLSNWYVRRNRRRFWKAAAGDDKQAAYLTLFECLDTVQRLIAPFMPFLAEKMYQNLSRALPDAAPSVHMADWPTVIDAQVDDALIAEFDVVQRVVGLGRTARNDTKMKVRQPLARLLVRVPDEAAANAVRAHEQQILEELNVKALELVEQDAELVSYRLKPHLPRVGKRYGKLIPAIRKALDEADGAAIATAVAADESFTIEAGGQTLTFEPEDVLVETAAAEGYACAEEGGYLVGLDTTLNDALKREGLARELIRSVQDARKQAGLDISDRIALQVTGSAGVEDALSEHRDLLMAETLATDWGVDDADYECRHEQGGESWSIALRRQDSV